MDWHRQRSDQNMSRYQSGSQACQRRVDPQDSLMQTAVGSEYVNVADYLAAEATSDVFESVRTTLPWATIYEEV
jgi:hypothetical protein